MAEEDLLKDAEERIRRLMAGSPHASHEDKATEVQLATAEALVDIARTLHTVATRMPGR
jgi:hypothetical protein